MKWNEKIKVNNKAAHCIRGYNKRCDTLGAVDENRSLAYNIIITLQTTNRHKRWAVRLQQQQQRQQRIVRSAAPRGYTGIGENCITAYAFLATCMYACMYEKSLRHFPVGQIRSRLKLPHISGVRVNAHTRITARRTPKYLVGNVPPSTKDQPKRNSDGKRQMRCTYIYVISMNRGLKHPSNDHELPEQTRQKKKKKRVQNPVAYFW